MSRLVTMRSYFAGAGHPVGAVYFAQQTLRAKQQIIARQAELLGFAPVDALAIFDITIAPPDGGLGDAPDAPVLAYVNAGEWKWKCECRGVGYIDLEDPIAMCADCWNAAHDHRWRPVQLPAELEAIEELLIARPIENRHWHQGETLEDLRAENELHGVEA